MHPETITLFSNDILILDLKNGALTWTEADITVAEDKLHGKAFKKARNEVM